MDKKDIILVVDDMEVNRLILEGILEDDYEIVQAVDGEDALMRIFTEKITPNLILLDIMMPNIDGFELIAILKHQEETADIPIIVITAEGSDMSELKALNAGVHDFIAKPFIDQIVKTRVDKEIFTRNHSKNQDSKIREEVERRTQTHDQMIDFLTSLIEHRNLESGLHVQRTKALAALLVDHMLPLAKYKKKLIDMDYELMLKAVPLHDVGKVSIPDNILLKPGKLTPEEFEIIKTHTTEGSKIVNDMPKIDDAYIKHCYDIARHHHERWDGNGYPDKLSGEDIPLSARLLAIVDVYDALVARRVYKEPFTHEEAMDIIVKGAGTQFDPHLIGVLQNIHGLFKECSDRLVAEHGDPIESN